MQNWTMPTTDDVLDTTLVSYIPNALKTLRSLHSGATEPAEMVAYMLWADTTNGLLKIRNAANTAWTTLSSLEGGAAQRVTCTERVSLSASTTAFLPPSNHDVTLNKVVIVSHSSTTSTSGNEWQFGLNNLTQSNSLFSTTVGTFTTGGAIGGGDITAHVVYALVPDQNAALDADDVLEFTMTKVGSATTITRFNIYAEFEAR